MNKLDFDYKLGVKQYNECFAKHLLEIVYDAKFLDAEQKDKPDIWDLSSSHGIEVTTISDTYYNSLRNYKKMWSRQGFTLEQIIQHQPSLLQGKLGIDKNGQIILLNNNKDQYTVKKNKRALISTIEMKIKKYQHYKKFKHNDLFIFATSFGPDFNQNHMQSAIKNVNFRGFNQFYDNVLVFTYDKLYIYNLKEANLLNIFEVQEADIDYADSFADILYQEIEKRRAQNYNDKNKENNNQSDNEINL